MSQNGFSVDGSKTLINGKPAICRGLRCSNALFSAESTDQLIANLPVYHEHGVNCISVFFMGNRFGDIAGYREDASLDPVYAERFARIIAEADKHGIIVLVGCLYWGETRAKYESWKQADANKAIANTVRWLAENDFRNTFVDVDNEGMGVQFGGFDDNKLVIAAKEADDSFPVAFNHVDTPPPEADLTIHHSGRAPGKPHIEAEGVPENAPGSYWGWWSRKINEEWRYRRDDSYWNYLRVGVYTPEMKENSKELADFYFNRGDGYLFASTWMQAVPPLGPHYDLGGDGSESDPGMRWWLEWLKTRAPELEA